MTDKPLIVLVEDDLVIAELIEYNLAGEGYWVKSFRSETELFQGLDSVSRVDLFLLDIMLPGSDGYMICRKLREHPQYSLSPIVMLTALGTEADKVRGLEAGADDYITKPFGIREFLARVQAHVRRYNKSLTGKAEPEVGSSKAITPLSKSESEIVAEKSQGSNNQKLTYKNILLDDVKHRVFIDGQEIEVTHREYELLKFLMLHRGIAYTRDDLLNHVWGYDYSGETRTVDVHIRQLRRKIEKDDKNPIIIETVRGRGYRFCE